MYYVTIMLVLCEMFCVYYVGILCLFWWCFWANLYSLYDGVWNCVACVYVRAAAILYVSCVYVVCAMQLLLNYYLYALCLMFGYHVFIMYLFWIRYVFFLGLFCSCFCIYVVFVMERFCTRSDDVLYGLCTCLCLLCDCYIFFMYVFSS